MPETLQKTPLEVAMDKFTKPGQRANALDFFKMWNTPPAVIAERLRRTSIQTSGSEIRDILSNQEAIELEDQYKLLIALQEMRNDIDKILYGRH